jgi:membrane protease YdiL (CAAX protease family)
VSLIPPDPEREPDAELSPSTDQASRPVPELSQKTIWTRATGLLIASILGSILVVPYSISVLKQSKTLGLPADALPVVMIVGVFIESVISIIAIAIGLGLGRRAGLGALVPTNRSNDAEHERPGMTGTIMLAVGLGVALGALIVAAGLATNRWMPEELADIKSPPPMESFLGSLGAGIREEVWLRYGFMTLLAWAGAMLTRRDPAGRGTIWVANVLAALLFGAIHLPQAMQLIGTHVAIVAFVLIGNGVPGIVWGWLYWRRGLIAAMISHFIADIVMKVIAPLLFD